MQFQLTINLVALVVAFVAALSNGETPLNVLQLLWVNLIMDSLAALGALCGVLCMLCASFVPCMPQPLWFTLSTALLAARVG